MNYCLAKDEFQVFFDSYLANSTLENSFHEDLQMRVDACMNWQDNLGILLYVFTHFLQRQQKTDPNSPINYVEKLYELESLGNFWLENIDRQFIEYMFHYNRTRITEDLPDTLIIILQNFMDRSYDSSFCF